MFKKITDRSVQSKNFGVLYPIPKDEFHLIANTPKKKFYETQIKNFKNDQSVIVLKNKTVFVKSKCKKNK